MHHVSSGVAIGCAGCAMHTYGPSAVGAQNLPESQTLFFTSKVIGYIRMNLEIYSLSYEKCNCSVRVQLAAN